MTNELKEVIGKIDEEFKNYFKNDSSVRTIFVAGSMAHDDYQDRMDNDYDIRVIADHVNVNQLVKFEEFLKDISKKLTTDELAVGYSCLVGPVNHKVSEDKKNILIHAMIHQRDQMDNFLPVTHKYQYGTRYRIVEGEDSLKRFQDVRYNLDELLNAHEGLLYCIDMLEKEEYRYLTWDILDNECNFNYHADKMPKETILENCFYSHNKFINNLRTYCEWNNLDIPEDNFKFALSLLEFGDCEVEMLFVIRGLLEKKEIIINRYTENPLELTINILKLYRERVKDLQLIFDKKTKDKCLIKS